MYQKLRNLKFCAPFKIQKRKGLSNFEKPVFDFSVLYPKKSGLSKKLKVSTLNIRIKQSGLKVSHSKVPSSVVFVEKLVNIMCRLGFYGQYCSSKRI